MTTLEKLFSFRTLGEGLEMLASNWTSDLQPTKRTDAKSFLPRSTPLQAIAGDFRVVGGHIVAACEARTSK